MNCAILVILVTETQPISAKPFHLPCKFQWGDWDICIGISTNILKVESELREYPDNSVFQQQRRFQTQCAVVNNVSGFNQTFFLNPYRGISFDEQIVRQCIHCQKPLSSRMWKDLYYNLDSLPVFLLSLTGRTRMCLTHYYVTHFN